MSLISISKYNSLSLTRKAPAPSHPWLGARALHIPRMHEQVLPPLPPPSQLLAAPASLVARLLVREYSSQAAAAARNVGLPGQPGIDARHDVRVALRRLRVTLRAYRTPLEECKPAKLARRAGALSRRVGVSRTHDVHLELLAAVHEARTARQRAVLDQLPPFGKDGQSAFDAPAFERRWQRFEMRLAAALETWTDTHHLATQQRAVPFSVAAADALERAIGDLQRSMARVTGPDDIAAMHAARLAIKAIRYLTAPLASDTDDASSLRTRASLRDAQELLGNINDVWSLRQHLRDTPLGVGDTGGLASRVLKAALAASDRDLTARITRAFASLEAWRAAPAMAATSAALRTLGESWRRGAGLPTEIERKWLLSALPPHVRDLSPMRIEQGYLPGDVLVERIRRVRAGRTTRWFRTVKLGRGLSRIEVEEETSAALGKALFALTVGRRVSKRRYAVSDGALVWEVDEFTDRELFLVEVELPDETTVATIPEWLAPWIVREVTDESSFTNWKLAR